MGEIWDVLYKYLEENEDKISKSTTIFTFEWRSYHYDMVMALIE